MRKTSRRSPYQQISLVYDAFSLTVIPLIDGLMRRAMLRRGVAQLGVRLHGIWINYYLAAPRLRVWQAEDTPILLLHGIGDSGATWSLVLQLLQRRRALYAIDLPGHGFSGMPPGRTFIAIDEHLAVVERFIREVIGRPALVVGNSLGGMLAARLARRAPNLVRGVVLINPGGALLEGRASYDPFFAKISQRQLRATWQLTSEMIRSVPRPLLAFALRGIQHMFQRPVILDAYAASDDGIFLSPQELGALATPATLIWGMDDHFLPAGSFAFFDAHLPPAARRLRLEHCGHLPQRERPLAVARCIERFARSLVVPLRPHT